MEEFILATSNAGKVREMQAVLGGMGIAVRPLSALDLTLDVMETGTSFEENALIKAQAVFRMTGLPAIADDSGLAVDALGGAPGIYSARYAGEGKTDQDRNNLLLKNMENIPEGKRQGQFVCAIACVRPGREPIVVRGECAGTILFHTRGEGGFGYDPLFYVPSENMTFGEIPPERKNRISHRAAALEKLIEKLDIGSVEHG